jgi:RHS repeat-associated protein
MRKYIIPQNPTINYFLGDNLGSTSVTADANGAAVSTIHYKPWGEIRTPLDSTTNLPYNPGPSNYTYTGQYSNMDDFGLMFYNARWYDPGISQFASPDTMIPNTYNPLDWNRYSYADYNPINRTDPSGHCYKLGKGTMTDDECEAGHESGYLTYEKHIKPYQDNRKRASVGMYCDEQRCWTDSATDISGTLQDPAVYISVSISCFGTGFCAALTSSITQFGWAACAASQTCLNLAKGYGIYYPPNNGYANGYTFQDFAEGQVLQHWGTDEGAFMSDAGTSASELSLPPDKWGTEPTYYRVVTPFGANTGGVASYYGLQGGGVQYVLGRSIEDYLAMNLLEKILH